jgi:hypothetical protein
VYKWPRCGSKKLINALKVQINTSINVKDRSCNKMLPASLLSTKACRNTQKSKRNHLNFKISTN